MEEFDLIKKSSEELAVLAQRGHLAALELLIERHKHEVYRVAFRMTGNVLDAEEIVQNSFERLLKHIASYDPARPFRPWLFSITINRARTFLRLKALRSFMSFQSDIELFGQSRNNPEKHAYEHELASKIEKALLTLPRKQREVFILKQIEGLSYDEIASITGNSIANLKVMVHRARKGVLEFLQEKDVTFSK